MNDFLNNLKSQLVYVLENQLNIKEEYLIKKLGTPDNTEILDSYFESLGNEIATILENNYEFIVNKTLYLINKLPDVTSLNTEDLDDLNIKITDFIDNHLHTLLFQKISFSILN